MSFLKNGDSELLTVLSIKEGQEVELKVCPYCKAMIPANSLICNKCGGSINGRSVSKNKQSH